MKLRILATVALIMGGVLGLSVLMSAGVYAADCPPGSVNPTYSTSLAECNIPSNAPGTDKELTSRVVDIINVVVGVVGIAAIAVVVLGGVLYVTSTGDAAKTTRAKNTVLYGLVGFVVAMLAFAIVRFVSDAVF